MITLKNITLRRGTKVLLDGVTTTINPGESVGLVGRNGAGKSTLFALLNGSLTEDGGDFHIPAQWRMGQVAQHMPETDESATQFVLEGDTRLVEVQAQLEAAEASGDGMALAQAYADLADAGAHDAVPRAQALILGLGFKVQELEHPVNSFSGGWRMRLQLARALMCPSDLLLLDEPTNHLDAESVDWLQQFLHRFTGTVVAITHDRYFLDNAAEWILELDRGHGIPYKGNYSDWLLQKGNRLEQEQKGEEARAKALKKELEWVRQNAKGRQAKSKARIARFEELSDYECQQRNETQEIFIPVAERLGSRVIEFKNVSKAFGDRLLIDNLSMNIPAGAIVGIIGPNGAGKSTLFKLIAGKEQPDSGEVEIGQTVKMAFVDQHRDALANDKTVWEDISGGLDIINVGKFQMASRAYAGRFNFNGQDQQKKVGNLSGGERGRLHLAKTLIQGGNVLLLDEPSNDLDVETLRALEDALLEYAGTVLVISHDRWFLDRIATHILAAEGDSQWVFFDGNYQEYEADKKKRLGEEGAAPKRMRYKALK